MKLLFVSTVPVFPPIDGVRIPPANYILGLKKSHQIDFLLLENHRQQSDWQETAEVVHDFWRMPIKRKSKLAGVAQELTQQAPYYGNWELLEALPEQLQQNEYDAVIACTPPAIAILAREGVSNLFPSSKKAVAAMSDVHSLVVSQQSVNAAKNYSVGAQLFHRIVYAMRTRILAKAEMRMLSKYHCIFVQTDKEQAWIDRKGGSAISEKISIITNAVSDDLYTLPLKQSATRLVFVGSMTGLYGERFRWFIHHVWRHLKQSDTNLTLTAIGKGAGEQLLAAMSEHGIEYVPFVRELSDVYKQYDILVAPIFKGYGLINKVVEAMAAGCLVVGDATAFNGIPDFEAGKHGLVANSEQEFITVLRDQVQQSEANQSIRVNARALMDKHFRWSQRIEMIENAIHHS